MKLLHLADLHLGKYVNDFNMIDDQRYILHEVLRIAKEKKADGLLIAGDVYDRSVPSEAAVRLLDDFLAALVDLGVAVFMISGNHDSDDRLDFGRRLFAARRLFVTGRYEGDVPQVALEDEYGPVNVYMLPFIKSSMVAHYCPEADTSTYTAAIAAALGKAAVDTSKRNVILAHQFVTAASGEPALAGSELAALCVGTVERVGAEVFKAFDYVALGHIHSPQAVGSETIRYAGSPLKYSLKEVGQDKSLPLVTLKEKGDVRVELLPLVPRRDMRRLKGPLSDLLAAENVVYPDDYIYATLTDETPVLDAMARLQQVYPHAMRVDYDNSHVRAWQAGADAGEAKHKSFPELMRDFYAQQKGGEPSEAEWRILSAAAREAGVD